MKKKHSYFLTILVILAVLVFFYYFMSSSYENYKNYKWVTEGTCASNKMQDLTKNDCTSYFNKSNYTITDADHGPPGCWLVLGDSLNGVVNSQPQFAGKGFGCWSTNNSDGKQCSADFPCVCK
jgi:CDP-diacylglycerol pyrophosphatase